MKKNQEREMLKGRFWLACSHLYWSDQWGKARSFGDILADVCLDKGRALHFSRSQALKHPVFKKKLQKGLSHLTVYQCANCSALYDEGMRLMEKGK